MTIYKTHRGIRYVEVQCSACRRDNHVVSEDALEFYAMAAPFQPYLCPTCRKRRDPDAALYGEMPRHAQRQAVTT